MPPPVLRMKINGRRVAVDSKADLLQLHKTLQTLGDIDVLAGFTEGTTDRDDDAPLTNAAIAYIQDNGEPASNIPARPFMTPGIEEALPKITGHLMRAGRAAMSDLSGVKAMQHLERAGIAAATGIQRKINEGIPPPLADSTLAKRNQNRKGVKIETANRAKGVPPSTEFVKPLLDTTKMRNAVTYVIRSRKARP